MKPEFKSVDLVRIAPDPNQPRKFFDPVALQELTDSIFEKGVIQPIVIRPTEDGKYMVVTGERRYRAALAVMERDKSKKTIPAVIRELTDQEALELQIIENLQRKEVHPMEEATAFKSLHAKLSTSEIAQKVGKSESYVLKRMKLNELIPEAQERFFKNEIEYSQALKMARMDVESQGYLIQISSKGNRFDLQSYQLYDKTRNLDILAKFKLDDPEINPEAGPCTTCQFNSAVSQIRFEDDRSTVCSRPACFDLKNINQAKKVFDEAKQNKDLVFVAKSCYTDEDRNKKKEAESEGLRVLEYADYDTIEEPEEIEDFETWRQSPWNGSDSEEPTEEEKEEYQNYVKEEEEKHRRYKELLDSGQIKMAFVVAGYDEGKTIPVILKTQNLEPNTLSKDEILEAEISKLRQKEERSKELDFSKKWEKARKLLFENSGKKLHPDTMSGQGDIVEVSTFPEPWKKALYLALFNDVGYYLEKNPRKDFEGSIGKFVTTEKLNRLLRHWIIRKLDAVDADAAKQQTSVLYDLLKYIYPEQIAAIDLEQDTKAKARAEKLEKKIAQMRKPQPKPARQLDLEEAIADSKKEEVHA